MSEQLSDPVSLKRLQMRSWRRGTKEMDLILGPFSDTALTALSPDQLALYEAMLGENDHDLYRWITARIGPNLAPPAGPARYAPLLDLVAAHAADRFAR